MPNKNAAIKDLRKNKTRAARNFRMKTHVRHLLKKAQELVKEGKVSEAKIAVMSFQQIADKASKHRVVSRSSINRKKASLMKSLAAAK